MTLKKQEFSEDEIPIFEEALVYARSKYWQMRMLLAKEHEHSRFSLELAMKKAIKNLGILIILLTSSIAGAQVIGFDCTSSPENEDEHVWRYKLEINKTTRDGVLIGNSLNGLPFKEFINVNFGPIFMDVIRINDSNFGVIHRKTLKFVLGGSSGQCKLVPVKKAQNSDKPIENKF